MEQEEETLRMESWGSGRPVERKGEGVSRAIRQKSGGLGHLISTRDSRGCGRGPYREGRSCWAGWEAAICRQDLTQPPGSSPETTFCPQLQEAASKEQDRKGQVWKGQCHGGEHKHTWNLGCPSSGAPAAPKQGHRDGDPLGTSRWVLQSDHLPGDILVSHKAILHACIDCS